MCIRPHCFFNTIEDGNIDVNSTVFLTLYTLGFTFLVLNGTELLYVLISYTFLLFLITFDYKQLDPLGLLGLSELKKM